MSDDSIAPTEAYRAKVTTGGRNAFLATLELWQMRGQLMLGPLRRTMGRLVAHWSK
jgi:hypothetical protein